MELLIIIGIIIAGIVFFKITGIFTENTELRKYLNDNKKNYNELKNDYSKVCSALEQKEKDCSELKNKEFVQSNWLYEAKKDYNELKNDYSKACNTLEQKERNYNELKNDYNELKNKENNRKNLFDELEDYLSNKEKAYKWLVPLVADIKLVLMEKSRDSNELITTKRGYETMARVDTLMREKKMLLEENMVLKYQLEYIKTLIPETEDIVEYDEYINESSEDNNPSNFLSKEEYSQLSDTEKNIRALEYYKQRKKRNWEIGRDFERYVGYKFELENCEVEYFGIEMKYNDLGRDLIVKRDDITTIVQCKYWSKNKIIHEKHIAQLFGTVIKYKIDNPHEMNVSGLFISHTILSEEAKRFACALDIQVIENMELGEYPMIKCKNNRDKDYGFGTRIYHLPMDQQYDTAKINKKNGDFCAFTITEAENQGYRRAYKWHGN